MIAKRIVRNKGTSSAARLVKYMVAAKGGSQPRSWERTSDYILATNSVTGRGEKVASYRVENCGTDDPADATMLILATQARNTRSKTDKTYHLVFSFQEEEKPSIDLMHKIEDELVEALGFADHQRISAVHQDTAHLHVHVAINKVHPINFRNVEPFYDKRALMAACEEIEKKYGLLHDDHGLSGTKESQRLGQRTQNIAVYSGITPLSVYVAKEVLPHLKLSTSWHEVHAEFAKHGLTVKLRGAGLVVGSIDKDIWCKGSEVSREFSLAKLQSKYGPFIASTFKVNGTYHPTPVQSLRSSKTLYHLFNQHREATLRERARALSKAREKWLAESKRVQHWYAVQRNVKKIAGSSRSFAGLPKAHKAALLRSAKNKYLIEKAEARKTPRLSWTTWLHDQAELGNREALALLRYRAEKMSRGNVISSHQPSSSVVVIRKSFDSKITKNGNIEYSVGDGGRVIDRAQCIKIAELSEAALLFSLNLAIDKFGTAALDVNGSDEFKKKIADIAGLRGLDISFSDQEMEGRRKAYLSSATSPMAKSTRKPIKQIASNDIEL